MQLVEKHVITKDHEFWQEIDKLSFLSKNLWNYANYQLRQHFFETGKRLRFELLYRLVCQSVDYKALPTKVSKQIIRRLDRAWESYFKAVKVWNVAPHKFKAKPKLPGYKDKVKGRNLLPYPGKEAIYKKELHQGVCHLSMSGIKFPTQATTENIVEVRLVPKACCYVIEVVYESQECASVKGSAIAGVDIGLSNLMAVTSNLPGVKPLLINGRPLKAINQLYNKRKAQLQSIGASAQIKALTHKRNCRVENYIHTASRRVIDWCKAVGVGLLAVGKNEGWKDSINISKRNNQQFVCIPHARLIEMLQYKGELKGVQVVVNEEAYTSKASALDGDPLPKYGSEVPKFSGKRVKRGLYKTATGRLINADVNGSMNNARKVISEAFDEIVGLPFIPVVVDPLRTTKPCPLGKFVQV
jgi:putative transposase